MDSTPREMDELRGCAAANREVFARTLSGYVEAKLSQTVALGARRGWFDASGCVWCLFDDEAFVRSGSQAHELRECGAEGFDLQVYWSIEDVVMPAACDERWVAERIAEEAERQLASRGFRTAREERATDEGRHLGVVYRKQWFR